MPSAKYRIAQQIEPYLAILEREGRSHVTLRSYRFIYMKALMSLSDAGLETAIQSIGEREIEHLRQVLWRDVSPVTRRWYLSILGSFLEWNGNPVIKHMMIAWPQGERLNVDWLEPLEYIMIEEAAHGVEVPLVHLEGKLGLRRISAMRLRKCDVHLGWMDVRGKGRHGGKWRQVPFQKDTMAVLEQWMAERNARLQRAQRYNPTVEDPEELLIWQRYGSVGGYTPTAIDNVLKRLSKRTGIKFSHHTLRRTFGRSHWMAGTPLETIATLMGHEDVKTTIKYLGIKLDDMRTAQDAFATFMEKVKRGRI